MESPLIDWRPQKETTRATVTLQGYSLQYSTSASLSLGDPHPFRKSWLENGLDCAQCVLRGVLNVLNPEVDVTVMG